MLWELKVDLWGLADVARFLQARAGRDLDLAVWNQLAKRTGDRETVGAAGQLLPLANGSYQTVTLGALTDENTPRALSIADYRPGRTEHRSYETLLWANYGSPGWTVGPPIPSSGVPLACSVISDSAE